MTAIRCEAVLRTVAAIASDRRLNVEVRFDGLEAHRRSGINLRLTGAKGVVADTQPASFVRDFLTTLDATKTKLPGEVIAKKLIATDPKPSILRLVNENNICRKHSV